MSARLRARDATGAVWEDPSADRLHDLISELNARFPFLVVERLDMPEAGQHYIQVWRHGDGGHTVEYRDGSPERHYRAGLAPVPGPFGEDEVTAIVCSWARSGDEAWRTTVPWHRWTEADRR